eukprot:2203119-Amphidinium_carterae.1
MSDWSDLLAELLGNDKGNEDGVGSTSGVVVPLPSEAKTSTPSISEPLLTRIVSAQGREYMEVAGQAALFQANQEIMDTCDFFFGGSQVFHGTKQAVSQLTGVQADRLESSLVVLVQSSGTCRGYSGNTSKRYTKKGSVAVLMRLL